MARRRSRIAHVDYGHFSVTVSASSAYISHRILDPRYDAGQAVRGLVHDHHRGRAGYAFDPATSRSYVRPLPGARRSWRGPWRHDTHWQVLVYLPRSQFVDLLALVAAKDCACRAADRCTAAGQWERDGQPDFIRQVCRVRSIWMNNRSGTAGADCTVLFLVLCNKRKPRGCGVTGEESSIRLLGLCCWCRRTRWLRRGTPVRPRSCRTSRRRCVLRSPRTGCLRPVARKEDPAANSNERGDQQQR
jgi:hypothetical protein